MKSKYPPPPEKKKKNRTREEVCAVVCKIMTFPVEMLIPKAGEPRARERGPAAPVSLILFTIEFLQEEKNLE